MKIKDPQGKTITDGCIQMTTLEQEMETKKTPALTSEPQALNESQQQFPAFA